MTAQYCVKLNRLHLGVFPVRRSKFEILADILRSTSGRGATKTQIVYKANLNFKLATNYINYLLKKGYLVEVIENNRKVYRTTKRGVAFLREFGTIAHDLKEMFVFENGV